MPTRPAARGDRDEHPITRTIDQLREETRVVLPGTQTFIGLQLSVVFTARFQSHLSPAEQRWHPAAMARIVLAAGLLALVGGLWSVLPRARWLRDALAR